MLLFYFIDNQTMFPQVSLFADGLHQQQRFPDGQEHQAGQAAGHYAGGKEPSVGQQL